jgi:hypothetical protein
MRSCPAWPLSLALYLVVLSLALGQSDEDDFEPGNLPHHINVAGIVGVRNVEHSIAPFLKLLAPFVNFTIVLDDSSDDGTLAAIESVAHETKVRRVLVKDGSWNRSETTDRNELLLAGGSPFTVHRGVVPAHY